MLQAARLCARQLNECHGLVQQRGLTTIVRQVSSYVEIPASAEGMLCNIRCTFVLIGRVYEVFLHLLSLFVF